MYEYKKEAFNLFENLLNKLKIDFVTILINLKVVQEKIDEDTILDNKIKFENPKCLYLKKDEKISEMKNVKLLVKNLKMLWCSINKILITNQ